MTGLLVRLTVLDAGRAITEALADQRERDEWRLDQWADPDDLNWPTRPAALSHEHCEFVWSLLREGPYLGGMCPHGMMYRRENDGDEGNQVQVARRRAPVRPRLGDPGRNPVPLRLWTGGDRAGHDRQGHPADGDRADDPGHVDTVPTMDPDGFYRCQSVLDPDPSAPIPGIFLAERCGWPAATSRFGSMHPITLTKTGEVVLQHESPSYQWAEATGQDREEWPWT